MTGRRELTELRLRPSKKADGRVFCNRYRTNWATKRISPCEYERRRFRRTGEVRYAFFRFLQFVIGWSRVRSSSFWSLSLKLISNRGPMDTVRGRQPSERFFECTKRSWTDRPT